MDLAQRLAAFEQADLYVVITESFCAGRTRFGGVGSGSGRRGGNRATPGKGPGGPRACMSWRVEFRRRTEAAGALLIIDDRVDIALAAGADGVHLGQTDLPVAAARRIAPDLIIGASSHSLEEALAAQEAGASYVNIGPIFPTATKPQAVALGVEAISRIAPYLRIPWSTMGGINQGNIAQVVAQGARHPAVMSAVTAAPDVSAAARALRAAIVSLEK